MALMIIKVEKQDVHTSMIGSNIELKLNENIAIVFSPEALEELINDYGNLKKYKKKS